MEKKLIADISCEPVKETSNLGKVSIFLDEGTEVTAVGIIYGIQHKVSGKDFNASLFLDHFNQRIKITHYRGNVSNLIMKVRSLAEANGFDKVIAFASRSDWQKFLRHGYVLEAVIKHYKNGEDAYIVSKFRSQERLTSHAMMDEILMIEDIMGQKKKKELRAKPEEYSFRKATRSDIPQLIELYQTIFETYPSPVVHADYLETVFGKENLFAVAEYQGKIVAAASAELDHEYMAAELTDCATHPSARGKGLMSFILQTLEEEIRDKGFICSYTMARAKSYGMNSVFYHMDYEFQGRLVNNCDIFGTYEDMNIWVKDLRAED